jgi:hypothetical protein
VAVTVYSNQALVTRRAVVSLSVVGTAAVKLLRVHSDRLQTTEPIGEKSLS